MAQNITLLGASYSDVPAVMLPKTGGGTARFTDTSDANVTEDKMLAGATGYGAAGSKITGTVTVVHYYTGSGAPSASLGEDGDIYLEVV